jgi:hypothetical protein
MTSLTEARPFAAPSSLIDAARRGSPLLWQAALLFAAAFALCLAAAALDPRLFAGVSVWAKPAKFYLSLSVHMLTLSWGLSLLPDAARQARTLVLAGPAFIALAAFEVLYITYRASLGEASHFNTASALAGLLYSLMGLAALALMAVTAWIGLAILRHGQPRVLAFATGLGFIVAAFLTTGVGLYLGNHGSHWIGGDQMDATGLPLLGWSTTGGDLRPAHFAALHMMQLLPFAGLLRYRTAAILAAALGTLATAALLVQAVNGHPLIAL